MAGILVSVEGNLPEHGREGVLALLAQHPEADLGVFLLSHDAIESELLPEHGRGLGQGQRRVEVEYVILRGKAVVQTVAELVRHHRGVTKLAGEVEHHVRVVARGNWHAVRTAGFTRNHRRIDPGMGEEVFDQLACTWRKAPV